MTKTLLKMFYKFFIVLFNILILALIQIYQKDKFEIIVQEFETVNLVNYLSIILFLTFSVNLINYSFKYFAVDKTFYNLINKIVTFFLFLSTLEISTISYKILKLFLFNLEKVSLISNKFLKIDIVNLQYENVVVVQPTTKIIQLE